MSTQGPGRSGEHDGSGEPPLPPVRYGVWALVVGILLAVVSIAVATVNDQPGGESILLTIGRVGVLVGSGLAVIGTLVILANGPRPRW